MTDPKQTQANVPVFADLLKRYMAARGLDRATLASKADLTQTTVDGWLDRGELPANAVSLLTFTASIASPGQAWPWASSTAIAGSA